MDPSDIQSLIGEAARRHGVLLEPDDPLFVIVTLNELALSGLIERVEAAVEAAQDQASAGAAQQIEAAKALAERVIEASANYAEERIRAAGEEAAARVRAAREPERSAWRPWMAIAIGAACLLIGALAAAWLQSAAGGAPSPRTPAAARALTSRGHLAREAPPANPSVRSEAVIQPQGFWFLRGTWGTQGTALIL